MPMLNPNYIKAQTEEQRGKLFNALQTGTEEEQKKAFDDLFVGIEAAMVENAEKVFSEMGDNYSDEKLLINRGSHRALTSKEKKFFNAVIEHQGFENLEEVFPETIINDVFKDISENHPLLRLVDAQTTSAFYKYIYSDPTIQKAFWGTLPDNIKQLIIQGFKTLSFEHYKLSGFVAVTKGFFKLGPNWLANYIIMILREIMEASLEIAVIDGDGDKKPIGMLRKLSGAVDGKYPYKQKITLNNLEPITLAGIRAAMSEAKTDNGRIAAIMNPMSYWAKIFHQLAVKDSNNNWHLIALPTGEEIVKSHAVPKDTVIFGNPKNYLLAVSGATELAKYTETLAIEDMDLYIAKFYGHGIAKNANAFFVADISGMPSATIPALEEEPTVQRPNPSIALKPSSED